MTDYTLSLTAEEFDELERIVRAQYRVDGIQLICSGKESKAALRKRTQIQGRIVGQIMDARRRAGEICPERDPGNPLLPAEEENDD